MTPAPLHVRLRDDADARTAVPLRPEWRVGIGPTPRGHAIVSHNRSLRPLAGSLVLPVLLAPIVIAFSDSDVVGFVREQMEEPSDLVILAATAVIAGGLVWRAWAGVRDALPPGAIEVTDRGVRYRGSTIPFERIQEVTSAGAIKIVADRRVLRISERFCPRAADEAVAHELRRLILEYAPR